jgi:N-acetylglutamate synthase-like GNAT family acetyltransferase
MISYSENDLKEEDLEQINKLLLQLSATANPVDWKRISDVMQKGYVFTARDEGKLIGMSLLIPLTKFMAFFGNVEDVVVSEDYRGQGIGKKLMENLIAKAKELGMQHLFLTSNKNREAARAIYAAYGFEEYDTTAYKLYLKK